MALRKGLLRTFQFADEATNRFVRAVSDAIDALIDDRQTQYSEVLFFSEDSPIPAGRSSVVFRGKSTRTLTLPLASAQGQGVGAFVWVSNFSSTSSVFVVPQGVDTLGGAAGAAGAVAVGPHVVICFISDGQRAWECTV